jgi:hypothetical protein
MARRVSITFAVLAVGVNLVALGCSGNHAAPIQTHTQDNTAKSNNSPNLKPVTPAERDLAMERLNSAIIAHGGAAKLAKLQTMIYRGEGSLTGVSGLEANAEQEIQLRFPDYMRTTHTLLKDSGREVIVGAVRPAGVWLAAHGEQTAVSVPDQIDDMRNELYWLWVRTLSPLKNEEFVLRPLTVEIVNKRPASVILVSHKGRPDIALHFDNETHLLVRMGAVGWREAGLNQRREVDFHEHQPTDGVMMPTIQIDKREGRQYAYWRNTTYRFLDKIDDAAFEKP